MLREDTNQVLVVQVWVSRWNLPWEMFGIPADLKGGANWFNFVLWGRKSSSSLAVGHLKYVVVNFSGSAIKAAQLSVMFCWAFSDLKKKPLDRDSNSVAQFFILQNRNRCFKARRYI